MQWVQLAEGVIAGVVAVLLFTLALLVRVGPQVVKNAKDIQALWDQFRVHRAATAGVISSPAPLAGAQSASGTGAVIHVTKSRLQTSLPRWSQLTDRNPDGSLPAQRANDCGEESVAIVYRSTRGVETEADYLRYLIHGPGGAGQTTADDLLTLLRRAWYKPSSYIGQVDQGMVYLKAAIAAQHPVIVLGRWVSPDVLHWVVVAAVGEVHVDYLDPWYGELRTITIADFQAKYAGAMVDAGEPVSYPPNPST